MSLIQTYNVETIARIDVVFSDGTTDQVSLLPAESVERLQERVQNLYQENCDNDELEAVAAYDYNGDFVTTLNPNEFFGALGGF